MSAVLAHRSSDGILILTDGAVYDAEHRLTAIERKVAMSQKVPLAIASRGSRPATTRMESKIIAACEQHGVDEGLEMVRAILPQWSTMMPRGDSRFKAALLVACISEQSGPQLWFLQTNDGPDLPAFELHRVAGNTFNGINGRTGDRLFEILPRPMPGQSPLDYWARNAVPIMQRAREEKCTSQWWEGSAHLIGGQVDLTLVTRAGAAVKTIHRWNDKIGELINPVLDRSAVNVVPIAAGTSRQQRRAAERAERKRA